MSGGGDITELDLKLSLNTLFLFRLIYLKWLERCHRFSVQNGLNREVWDIHTRNIDKK